MFASSAIGLAILSFSGCTPPAVYLYSNGANTAHGLLRIDGRTYAPYVMDKPRLERRFESDGFRQASYWMRDSSERSVASREEWRKSIDSDSIEKVEYVFERRFTESEKELIGVNTLCLGVIGAVLGTKMRNGKVVGYNWTTPLKWVSIGASVHIAMTFPREKLRVLHNMDDRFRLKPIQNFGSDSSLTN